MIELNKKEQQRKNVIIRFCNGEITKKEATSELVLSEKQVGRIANAYREEGEQAFIHKNKGRKSLKKIPQKIRDEVVKLYVSEYFDFNFTHFLKRLERFSIFPKRPSTTYSGKQILFLPKLNTIQ